jgi:hypothetical protein
MAGAAGYHLTDEDMTRMSGELEVTEDRLRRIYDSMPEAIYGSYEEIKGAIEDRMETLSVESVGTIRQLRSLDTYLTDKGVTLSHP